ncbi:hypothetical protein CCACVL1_19815 [Corchorus capsularis]|uniref:Uncharacterized protein n=1 Tax=Corchorus capsularis TaxID=210143 RepID=A0A1R3HEN6_COCAP|nr:hypothetical protein CCACVL1_19815 [Corchorus capsularis]
MATIARRTAEAELCKTQAFASNLTMSDRE